MSTNYQTETSLHLQKQREQGDRLAAARRLEATQKAVRAEEHQAQQQAALDEAARQKAYEEESGATAERERASAEWHARLQAETERQAKLLSTSEDWSLRDSKEAKSLTEVARERAYAVLMAERAIEENTIEFKVEKLIRQVAAIERRLDHVQRDHTAGNKHEQQETL